MKKLIQVIFFTALFLPVTGRAHTNTGSPQVTFLLRQLLNSTRKNGATTEDVTKVLNQMLPADIRPYVALSLSNSSAWNYLTSANNYQILNGDNYLDFCKRFNLQGIPFYFEISDSGFPVYPSAGGKPGDSRYTFSLEQIEEVFKSCNHCAGVETGEVFWAYDNSKPWLLNVLRICKKYGKKAIISEGAWKDKHWSRFFYECNAELTGEELGKYLVPSYKNTKPMATCHTLSSLFGAWLTGTAENTGIWNDTWVWCYQSFGHANEMPPYQKSDGNEKKYPYTYFLREWLLGASMGCTVMSTESPQWTRDGVPDGNFGKYLYPFIKAIAEHHIIPRKEAVMAKVKAMIDPFGKYSSLNYNPSNLFLTFQDSPSLWKPTSVDPFGMLYRNSYGFSDEPGYVSQTAAKVYYGLPDENIPDYVMRENIPNESKYFFLPILPHPSSSVPPALTTVRLSDYRSDIALKQKLDSVYKGNATLGKAWAVEVDHSIFVLNTHENTDIDQTFKLQPGGSDITMIKGNIPFQNIIFGKREGTENYWFQANGYTSDGVTYGQRYQCVSKPTTISFLCREEPDLLIEDGRDKYVNKNWEPETKVFTLVISHEKGAVNFRIKGRNDQPLPVKEISSGTGRAVLHQNFPNPFRSTTIISYHMPARGHVCLKLFDLTIKEMAVITDTIQDAGYYRVDFNAEKLPGGIYIITLWVNDKYIDSKKMVLEK